MTSDLIYEMIKINGRDTLRINHALKVLGLARCIAHRENVSDDKIQIIEIAAVLHDIGIKYCEAAFGRCTGKMQEKYGPGIAAEILDKYDLSSESKQRVLFLIANHHTYDNIDGIDYRILIEADFLVNCEEGNMSKKALKIALNKYFKTDTSKQIAKEMFRL